LDSMRSIDIILISFHSNERLVRIIIAKRRLKKLFELDEEVNIDSVFYELFLFIVQQHV
jgi:hypothetical protein